MSPEPPLQDHAVEAVNSLLAAVWREAFDEAHAILARHPDLADSSIHVAAAVGRPEAVRRLLQVTPALAVVPAPGDGPPPLVLAAQGGLAERLGTPPDDRRETVVSLLDAGADPNTRVVIGDGTPIPVLYFACVSDNRSVAQVLLERGADPNDGESLYHAAEHGHREILALLVAHGAEISAAHARWGNTPLYFLAGYRQWSTARATVMEGMRWLLEQGADPNVPSRATTAHDGRESAAPDDGETPLHRAAAGDRDTDMVRLLLSSGADAARTRRDGRAAFALAHRNGNRAVAALLAAAAPQATALDDTDRFCGAVLTADDALARMMLAERPSLLAELDGEQQHALQSAVLHDDPDAIRLLVAIGWPLAAQPEWGGTPLHWACWFGRPRAVAALLAAKAEVNVRDTQYGSAPIAWAAHGSMHARPGHDDDYLAIVELMLGAGAEREAAFNQWGEAPETLASERVAARLRAAWGIP